jgi:predicted nucleic acid-binding protein
MSIILFDTDVLIDLLRGKEHTQVQVLNAIPGAQLFCSVITVGEIYAVMLLHEKTETERLLNALQKIPVSEDIARLAGELRSRHKSIELLDCIIAATAMSFDAELLTKNIKHYPMKGLRLTQIS